MKLTSNGKPHPWYTTGPVMNAGHNRNRFALCLKALFTKTGSRTRWRLMSGGIQLETGTARTDTEARVQARAARGRAREEKDLH